MRTPSRTFTHSLIKECHLPLFATISMPTPELSPVPIPDPHGTTMRFVSSMSTPRTKPQDKLKNIKEWSLPQAELERSNYTNLCEFLSADRPWTKPFFDTESYHPEKPEDQAIQAILERSLLSVDKVMQDQPGYARSAVLVGQRHGVDPKHGTYKVSFRMWVIGFKVQYPQLRDLVVTKGVAGDGQGLLDKSVYKAPEQLLNCMGCSKGSLKASKGVKKVDDRLLKPLNDILPWSTFLVQNLRGDERPMIIPAVSTNPSAQPAQPTNPHTLDAFLKPRLAKRGTPYRFNSTARPFGCFWVSEADMPRFYDLYTSHLEAGNPISLTERLGPQGPVVVDIDLRFPLEVDERRYTPETVRSVAIAFQQSLRGHLSLTDDQLLCYVLERTSGPYQNDKLTKDGFHLVFPHARCDRALKDTLRVEAMATCGVALKATGSLTSVKDIVDGNVVNWYVYGSGKPNVPPYMLTRVLGADGTMVGATHTLRGLVELLRVSEKSDALSSNLATLTVADQALEATSQSPSALNPKAVDAAVEEVSFELLDRVVMGLSVTRAQAAEPDWVEVVWAVLNVSRDNDYLRKGRDLVHRFSEQARDRYSSNAVEDKLNALKPRQPGELRKHFGTLRLMLKADNAELFGELFDASPVLNYAGQKRRFEQTHFKVMSPLLFATVGAEGVVSLKKRREFMDTYENVLYEEEVKGKRDTRRFITKWLQDPAMRTYERVDFLPPPLPVPKGVYNMYRGLRVERLAASGVTSDTADFASIQDLLKKLCGGRQETFDWVEKWLAHMVQRPGELPEVAIVWYSERHGVGKNMFLDWFGEKVLGDDLYFTTAEIDRVLGRFADGMARRVLVSLDEMRQKETFEVSEVIKNKITCKVIVYEEKGASPLRLLNAARLAFTTNNILSMKVETADRRVMAEECESAHAQNRAYFTAVFRCIAEDNNVVAYWEHLKQLDVEGMDFQGTRPRTQLWEDMRAANIPPLAKLMYWLVTAGDCDGQKLSAMKILDKIEGLNNRLGKMTFDEQTLGLALGKYPGAFKKWKSNGRTLYKFDKLSVDRVLRSKGMVLMAMRDEDDASVEEDDGVFVDV